MCVSFCCLERSAIARVCGKPGSDECEVRAEVRSIEMVAEMNFRCKAVEFAVMYSSSLHQI